VIGFGERGACGVHVILTLAHVSAALLNSLGMAWSIPLIPVKSAG
jgi:hypothetical protein